MPGHLENPTFTAFLHGFVRNWAAIVSGGLSAPFTVTSIYSSNLNVKIIFAVLAICGVLTASYQLWAQERGERVKIQNELETLTSTHLEIVFGGDTKPYFEQQPTIPQPGGMVADRRYRVGVRATGRIVSKAQVVLENCEPNDAPGIHLEHALQVMGHPGMYEVSVQPGESASAFFDVIYDELLDGRLHHNAFGLCYAAPVRSSAILRGSYLLTLRVEGGGMQSRKKFRVFQEPATKMLTMREVTDPT